MLELYEKIRTRREELGMSQAELAKKVGYTSRSTITRIEKGEIDLSRTKIVDFAKALKVTPAYLMGWEDEEGNEIEGTPDIAVLLDDDSTMLLESVNKLNPSNRLLLNNFISILLSQQEGE